MKLPPCHAYEPAARALKARYEPAYPILRILPALVVLFAVCQMRREQSELQAKYEALSRHSSDDRERLRAECARLNCLVERLGGEAAEDHSVLVSRFEKLCEATRTPESMVQYAYAGCMVAMS